MTFAANSAGTRLAVGRPTDNRVTLLSSTTSQVFLPLIVGTRLN